MPTIPYHLRDGTPAPGTTTVIGRSLGWAKDNLIGWAYKQGKLGLPLRETVDAAATIGTVAHAMVEAHIHGAIYAPPTSLPPESLVKAQRSFQAFREWAEDTRIHIIATEVHLVSERHRFGGTPDWIALRGNGRLVLPDVKTSSGTFPEHIVQIAAYVELWEENFPEMPLNGGAFIARFDKNTGGFSVKWIPRDALRPAWETFKHLRALYDLRDAVSPLAK